MQEERQRQSVTNTTNKIIKEMPTSTVRIVPGVWAFKTPQELNFSDPR